MPLLHNHLMDLCSYVCKNTLLAAKGGCICTPLTPSKSATEPFPKFAVLLNQYILQWIALYLYNRQHYVVVDDGMMLHSCVTQGSVLGPLLFLICINPWHSLMDPSWQCSYADDIHLYKPINHPGDYIGLQSDIDVIQDCNTTNYLTLNPHKCKNFICSMCTSIRAPTGWRNNRGSWISADVCASLSGLALPKPTWEAQKFPNFCFAQKFSQT